MSRSESLSPPGVSTRMIAIFAFLSTASSSALETHFAVAGLIVSWSWIE